MSATNTQCPTDAVLSAFGLGKLDADSAETVTRHLEACADCRQRVAGISGDSFVGRLRQAEAVGKPAARERTYVPGESLANAANSTDGSLEDGLPRPSRKSSDAEQDGLVPARRDSVSAPPELPNHPDYELIKQLGQGGMGTVYLAKNRMMNRLEVLKVISKALLDRPGALERFQQEIRSAAKLAHPNIVAAYSVLRPGDLLVFAMEYVKGQDLSEVVGQRGPLPVANAAFYIHQVANGLQHAFEKGMVHRDIKPNNLMLAIDGKRHVVKILDFGLAKATSEKGAQTGLTKSGQMLGTPDYVAPEQTLNAHQADIRADIYSLGCTLYFLLSGGPPFQEASLFEILKAHHEREPKPLNLVRPDVPVELATIVAKMMAKDPAKRYQTPIEVAKALVPFFKPGQAPAAPSPAKPCTEEEYPQLGMETAARPQATTPRAPLGQPLPPQPGHQPTPTPVPVPVAPVAIAAVPITAAAALPLVQSAELLGLSIDTHRPAAKRRNGWSSLPPWQRWAAFGGGALTFLLGVALLVRTPLGTVEIALSDPNAKVEVNVDGNHIDIAGPDQPLSLEVGEHNFKVTGKGYETISDTFTVTKGPNPQLTIKLKKQLPKPVSPEPVSADAKGPIDLLKKIDPKRDGLVGEWQLVNGELITPAVRYAMLEIPYDPPREYRLTIIAECAQHANDFNIGAVVGSSQAELIIDGFGKTISGMAIDGKSIARNPTRKDGCFLLDGRPNTIVCTVRERSVQLTCNGTLIVDWQGDPKRLSVGNYWPAHNRRRLFIGDCASSFRISRLELEPLSTDADLANQSVDLPKRIDPKRDAAQAEWESVEGELVPLFNGKDLTGWKTHPNQPGNWRVEKGVLIGSGPKVSHLYSQRGDFTNFHLRVTARVGKDGDSGAYVRSNFGPTWDFAKKRRSFPAGYAAQIYGVGPIKYKTGSLLAPHEWLVRQDRSVEAPNKWFTLEFIAEGNHLVVKVEGQKTADYTDDKRRFREGHIALQQNANTAVQFREIEIKELP